MGLKSYIPGLSNGGIDSLDEVDDETLDRAVKILEEQNEKVNRENLFAQAQYLRELEGASEDEFKIGFIQDREESRIADQTIIGPEPMEEVSNLREKGYMVRGDDLVRIMTVTGFPSKVGPGILTPLYVSNENIRITQHIQPRDSRQVLKKLKRRLNRLWAKIIRKREKGDRDTKEQEEERATIEALIWDIITGRTKLFDQSIYIEIVADSKDELDLLTRDVINTLGGRQIDVSVAERHQIESQKAVAPLAKDTLKGTRQLHQETSLSTMFPFIEPELVDPDGVFYGFKEQGDPVFFEPFTQSSYIEIITGKQGSGKTFAKCYELLIRYMKDETWNAYVLDPKSDFAELARMIGGEVIEIGSETKLNPLAIEAEVVDEIENPYQNKVRSEMEMYRTHFEGELDANHRGVLQRVIRLAKLRYGITEDPETHDNKNPIIQDHITILGHLRQGKDPTDFIKFDRSVDENRHEELMEEIQAIEDRMMESDSEYAEYLFNGLESFREGGPNSNLNGRTSIDLDSPLTVFSMEAFADSNQTPLMMHVVLDLIYQRATRNKEKTEVVADEVHYLFRESEALEALNLFARHHRHSRTRLSLMSQTTSEFISDQKGDGGQREEIYQTADMKRIFYHKTVSDEVADYHNLTNQERNFITNAHQGEKHGTSQYLMEITDIGKVQVSLEVSNFAQYVLDDDFDPWHPIINENLTRPSDVEWLAEQDRLEYYADDIADETLASADVGQTDTPADD